jgi:hypothetical protein
MRDLEQIKSRISDPYSVPNFVSNEDIASLIEIFKTSKERIHKNTGPVTVDIADHLDHPAFKRLLAGIQSEIGPFEITAGLFFYVEYPHVIHNDDTFELPDVYKAITVPLEHDGQSNPKLCFFDQFYFKGPAKFFNGETHVPSYFNTPIYDYTDVEGLVDSKIVDDYNYFTHLKPKWLQGLSLHSALDWVPGSIIIFDSTRLHCASDFRQQKIKNKLGLSIFTKRM